MLKYNLRPKHENSMCEFEFHCWKLREFTENEAGHILNLMEEIFKVFFCISSDLSLHLSTVAARISFH